MEPKTKTINIAGAGASTIGNGGAEAHSLLEAYARWRARNDTEREQADEERLVRDKLRKASAALPPLTRAEVLRVERKQAKKAAKAIKKARRAAALVSPKTLEERALAKSVTATTKARKLGMSDEAVALVAFGSYRDAGGRATARSWQRAVAARAAAVRGGS